jgi:iron complex outermembrane receptor protein/vitamin B12 transporter
MPFFGVPDNDSVQTDRNYLFGLTAQSQLSEKWSGVLRFGATNRRLLFDNPLLSGSGGLGNVVTIAGANGYSTTGQAVLDFGAGSFPSRNARQGVYLQTTYLAAPGVTVSGGANYEREQNFPDFTSPADAERNNKGFWTEGRVMLFNRISATGGVNFSHIERYDSAWSPRGSFAFFVRTPDTQDLIGDTRVTLNIGRGLKAVSITAVNNSLYRLLVKTPSGAALAQSAGIGPILPERSRTFDVGVEQGLWKRRVRARVAYFDNEYFDLIEFVGPSLMAQFGLSPEVIAAASSGARLNASSFKARGVETSAEAFFNGFRMSGSYTFLDATTTQSFQSSALFPAINPNIPGVPIGAFSPLIGERPFRRPAHTGNMMVSYTRGKGAITLSGYFVGKSDDSTFLSDASFGNTMLLPNQNLNFGYAKMDLSGSYQIHPRVRWHTTIENLLNRDYQPVFGFPALPITFRAGISAVLQGS